MKWKFVFSGPSFETVERILRQMYGCEHVAIDKGKGQIILYGTMIQGYRVRFRGHRVQLERRAA